MHCGSLDKYTGGALITQMNLACGVAPLYMHKCVHSHVQSNVGWRSETQGRERDVRLRETVGNRAQESASAPTSPLLCVFRFLWRAPAASDSLWMVPHTDEISVCSPDPHFSSPPLWLLKTRWSCYNVRIYKVPNIWFLHLGWNADSNAGMSRSRENALYHFQSAWWLLCSQACVFVCIAANWAEIGRKGDCFYSIFTILFLSPVLSINLSSYSPLPSNRNKGKPIGE